MHRPIALDAIAHVESGRHAQHQLTADVGPRGLAVVELDQDRHIAVGRLQPLVGVVGSAERPRFSLVLSTQNCCGRK
ncbi:MAG: hypothetical protein ACRDTH_17785 [Pseudonocardiaceae bacterium]